MTCHRRRLIKMTLTLGSALMSEWQTDVSGAEKPAHTAHMASRLFRERSLIRRIIAYYVGHLTTCLQEGSRGAISELKRQDIIISIKNMWKSITKGLRLCSDIKISCRQKVCIKDLRCISRMETFGRYSHFNPHFILRTCLWEAMQHPNSAAY